MIEKISTSRYLITTKLYKIHLRNLSSIILIGVFDINDFDNITVNNMNNHEDKIPTPIKELGFSCYIGKNSVSNILTLIDNMDSMDMTLEDVRSYLLM